MIDESYLIEGASGDFLFIEGVGLKSEGLGKVELFVNMVQHYTNTEVSKALDAWHNVAVCYNRILRMVRFTSYAT